MGYVPVRLCAFVFRVPVYLCNLFLCTLLPTITHKIFETNSSFHVQYRTTEKGLISVFQKFSATINKTFILAGTVGTRLCFYEV